MVGLGAGCSNHSSQRPEATRPRRPRPTTTVPITVAPKQFVIGLVTGTVDAPTRQGMIRSAELAVSHVNEDNRLPGWRLELSVVDATKPDLAAKAVRKLADRREVAAIIGPGDLATQAKLDERPLTIATVPISEISPGPLSMAAFVEDYAASEVADPPGPLGPATYAAIVQLVADAAPAMAGSEPDRGKLAAAVAQRLAAVATPSTTSTSSTRPVTNEPNSA